MPVLYERYRHSVSSANLWRESPSSFIWRYGLRRWGRDVPRTIMGKVAEAAYANALINGLSADEAQADAVRRFHDWSEGEDFPEAEAAGWIARGFVEGTKPEWGKLIAHAPWRPIQAGLDHEVSLKPDFVFENALVDTKGTLRMPSKPSFGHARQIAAYAREWKLPGVLFYAVPRSKNKQYESVDCVCHSLTDEDAEDAWNGLLFDWKQIDAFDRRFTSPADAMTVTPINTDSFYWDEEDIPEAMTEWINASEKEHT